MAMVTHQPSLHLCLCAASHVILQSPQRTLSSGGKRHGNRLASKWSATPSLQMGASNTLAIVRMIWLARRLTCRTFRANKNEQEVHQWHQPEID